MGKVFIKLNRPDEAISHWNGALERLKSLGEFSDFFLAAELSALIERYRPQIKKDNMRGKYLASKGQSVSNTIVSPPLMVVNEAGLSALYNAVVRSSAHLYPSNLLQAVRGNLSHASGRIELDEIIAIAYLQVNMGNLPAAIAIFSQINLLCPSLPASYMGLGSALALQGAFDDAITAFSTVISIDPTFADAWKRRGQTRAARELLVDSINDLTHAIELAPKEGDNYFQRGQVIARLRFFQRAVGDFQMAKQLKESSPTLFNSLAMSLAQLGDLDACLLAYDQALRLDGAFIEAWLNRGRMLREAGRAEQALESYNRAISLDKDHKFPVALKLRGLLFYGMGHITEASVDLKAFLSTKSGFIDDEEEARLQLALCHFSLKQFESAVFVYRDLLSVQPLHFCRHVLQMTLFYWRRLDCSLESFNIDTDLDPRIKDGYCKREAWNTILMEGYRDIEKPPANSLPSAESVSSAFEDIDMEDRIVVSCTKGTRELPVIVSHVLQAAVLLQLDCIGFLPNRRQRLMFGLASYQCATILRSYRPTTDYKGDDEEKVGSSCSSWREWANIAVRWRQVSEPGDVVFWIDGFPTQAFKEGFGLTTPLVTGEMKTLRYYSYYSKAVATVLRLLIGERGYFDVCSTWRTLSPSALDILQTTKIETLEQLWTVVGVDFYVVTHVKSILPPDYDDDNTHIREDTAEGTRITLQRHPRVGFDFSIRTPGTPERWKWYSDQLSVCFSRLQTCLHGLKMNELGRGVVRSNNNESVLRCALEFLYYFVNFAPLSRGSAATAYALLNACLLANEERITSSLPKNCQLDWEAILAESLASFVETAMSALRREACIWREDCRKAVLSLNTYGKMIDILNINEEKGQLHASP